jgi:hypothetical protein
MCKQVTNFTFYHVMYRSVAILIHVCLYAYFRFFLLLFVSCLIISSYIYLFLSHLIFHALHIWPLSIWLHFYKHDFQTTAQRFEFMPLFIFMSMCTDFQILLSLGSVLRINDRWTWHLYIILLANCPSNVMGKSKVVNSHSHKRYPIMPEIP